MANNKIKFLRGTSSEYTAAEKDNDTIYFTTDDGKLYIGDKEVSGSDIIIDDNMSDTSKNPVQNKVVNAALKSKADQTTVDNVLAQKANLEYVNTSLTGKSDIGHTHDDRYYTESEIDTKLNTKLNTSLKGAAKGLAELDSSGKVPSAQLPSYVDDVLEYTNKASFPTTGESGKIYIAQDTNKTYRWSGSTYVEISPSLALGETSATAYRGDRGKVAYDHSQTAHAPSNAQANVIETVKVNGTALTPSSKAVNISVPTVGNGTITITQNGSTKGTFTTNQSGNTTIALDGNNTTYSAGTGLSLSGTTFNHKNSVTAGTAQGDASKTLTFGGTFTIPTVTYDAQGHITAKGTTTMTMPANPNSWRGIQNNLTSNSTTDSLSAAQGKVLKGLVDGKAAASHTHSYLPLSGGTLTGDVVLPITKSSADASLPVAGATMSITDITSLSDYKTYLGSFTQAGTWYNLISTRHRNGSGDGSNYGMYLRSTLTSSGDLTWGKQYLESSWQAERTILDSSNYTSYTVTKTGSGASGTWDINVTGSSATSSKLTSSSYTTISIATSDWSTNSSGGYVCTKTLSSAMAYTNFNFDVVLSTDQSAAKLQIEAWNNIIADGEITQTTSSGSTTAFTFYAFTNKPSVALTVGIQGVS